MAKKTWNPGTAPTGVGGDTPYSANNNHQSNADELYAHCGADADGNLPAAQPINKGGTGATTAATARDNLGLGSAATQNTGSAINDVMRVGAFGFGGLGATHYISSDSGLLSSIGGQSRIFRNDSDYARTNTYGASLYLRTGDTGAVFSTGYGNAELRLSTFGSNGAGTWYTAVMLSTLNTTVDANGFIKSASPIVQLYADKIELNEEAEFQNISFEKLGVGDYLIQGSSGFAQEGWYVEQPKDANGNVYHAVLFEALENGDLSIKTYNKTLDGNGNTVADLNSPVDIKENRFISIRLNELPTDSTAPMNPTIVDNEGNPAPTKYHQLVEGMWVISVENQELLETERMAQMPKLTRRQFRLALVTNGYDLAEIEALIASIEDPLQRQIIQIEWQDSTVFERTSNSLNYMATLLELDRDQINTLWQQALLL